jgi:hypothetical protein
MTSQPMSLYLFLQDEAPRIGSGKRKVTVVSVGPKWVRLKYVKAKMKNRSIVIYHKLPRKTWDRLMRLKNKDDEAA